MQTAAIGILGARFSREVQRVREELKRRGVTTLLADLSGFPTVHKVCASIDELQVGPIDLHATPVWLLRQLEAPRRITPDLPLGARAALQDDIEDALIDDRESLSLLESLTYSLADTVRVINPPSAIRLHSRKPYLMAALARKGANVPESLTTTDRRSALDFVDEHHGQVICKAAAGGGQTRMALDVLDELTDNDGLPGPLLFQRRIIGTSLRAYVVDSEVVSCSEVIHGDVVDWRTDQLGLEQREIDEQLGAMLVEARKAAGLNYAGIDVELDIDETPYVLDVNPAPLFASYEHASGHDVAGPLADLLIAATEAS